MITYYRHNRASGNFPFSTRSTHLIIAFSVTSAVHNKNMSSPGLFRRCPRRPPSVPAHRLWLRYRVSVIRNDYRAGSFRTAGHLPDFLRSGKFRIFQTVGINAAVSPQDKIGSHSPHLLPPYSTGRSSLCFEQLSAFSAASPVPTVENTTSPGLLTLMSQGHPLLSHSPLPGAASIDFAVLALS